MRAVLDTNVLVSALILPLSRTGSVLLQLRQGMFTILYAQSLLEELVDVLNRPRLRQKYNLTTDDIKTVINLIFLRGESVQPEERITICRDPKDNKFLEVALAGQADAIVSGDQDLLILHPFSGIPIISPPDFLQLLDTLADEPNQ